MFPTTRWTLIQQANKESSEIPRKALQELCQQYAQPVFVFIKRRVNSHEKAEDATQEFFAQLMDGRLLQRADRDRGRFRSFLLHAVRGFLSDMHDYENAVKRGGRVQHVRLESQSMPKNRSQVTAEEEFDLQWIRSLLQTALAELEQEYTTTERGELFETLKGALDDSEKVTAREVGLKLRMTDAAVRVALHRMRKRLGQLIRQLILETVSNVEEVDDEINKLMQLLETNR